MRFKIWTLEQFLVLPFYFIIKDKNLVNTMNEKGLKQLQLHQNRYREYL
jgi:hypothetical protein